MRLATNRAFVEATRDMHHVQADSKNGRNPALRPFVVDRNEAWLIVLDADRREIDRLLVTSKSTPELETIVRMLRRAASPLAHAVDGSERLHRLLTDDTYPARRAALNNLLDSKTPIPPELDDAIRGCLRDTRGALRSLARRVQDRATNERTPTELQ